MSVIISDETLRACGMTEAEFKQEVALLLFHSGKLALGHASKFAQIDKIMSNGIINFQWQ